MDTDTANGITRTEKSNLSVRRLQLATKVFILAQVDQDYRSLSPLETEAEPNNTHNRNRIKHSTRQTYKTIARHLFLGGNPYASEGSKRDNKGKAHATQPVHR
jgi:hypothetical protein